jgi:hypothetical protein
MSNDDYGFKFQIGDDVVFSGARRAAERVRARKDASLLVKGCCDIQAFTVVGRHLEQCYGGTQRHYHLRGIAVSQTYTPIVGIAGAQVGLAGLFMASEVELESAPPADAVDPADGVSNA